LGTDLQPSNGDIVEAEPSSPADDQSEAAAEEVPTFSGDVTANAHSVLASQIFEQAVGDSPIVHQVPELTDALSSLRDMIAKIKEDPPRAELRNHRPLSNAYAKAPLPPLAEAVKLLENADGKCSATDS
jgi:predicted trehalose synthase